MAKPKAAARSGKKAKPAGVPMIAKVFLFASAMPLAAVLLPTCLVLGLGMSPTVVCYVFDRTRDRYLGLTVGIANLCGALPGLVRLWTEGHSTATAKAIMLDPLFWLFATTTAGLGWLIYTSMPPVIAAYYSLASEARIRNLKQRRKALVEAWGEEIDASGEAPPAAEVAEPE